MDCRGVASLISEAGVLGCTLDVTLKVNMSVCYTETQAQELLLCSFVLRDFEIGFSA